MEATKTVYREPKARRIRSALRKRLWRFLMADFARGMPEAKAKAREPQAREPERDIDIPTHGTYQDYIRERKELAGWKTIS
jgi:hypothetical protein